MRITLDDAQLELLAALIAERLRADRPAEMVDAAELAKRLGRSREFVYDHVEALGGVRVGDGPRPRLLFPWPTPLDRAGGRSSSETSQAPQPPASTGVRPRRKRSSLGTRAPLLPIAGSQRPSETIRGGRS